MPAGLAWIVGLLVLAWFAALICQSLANFSRSRLAALCKERDVTQRFGMILRYDEDAWIAWDMLQWAALAVALSLFGWRFLPSDEPLSALRIVELVIGLVVLVFAVTAVPWSLSRVTGEIFLVRSWPLIYSVMFAMQPLLWLTRKTDMLAHRLVGREDPSPETAANITEEIQSVVDEGAREGSIESTAGAMIQRVMELSDEDVRAIMTPRTDMVCVSADVGTEEARRILLEAGHSRVPVIGESPDDIIGLLYAKDLLRALGDGGSVNLRELVREPAYIPETTTIDTLLERMQRDRIHLAIVLDEYGGVTGLVTLEDILEEIVGEIADEYDPDEAVQLERIDAHTYEVDARIHLDDLNEQLGLDLPEDRDFDTLGGFAFSELGRIPDEGEQFGWQSLKFTVLEADKRKILKLRIEVRATAVPPVEQT